MKTKLFIGGKAIGLLLAVLLIIKMSGAERVCASSADIIFSANKGSYEKNERIEVEINISAEIAPGDFEGFISYNSEVVEYENGPDCVAGGEGVLRIIDKAEESLSTSRKYILYFTAKAPGYSQIGIMGDPELYEYEEGYLMSVATQSVTVEVLPDKADSDDSSLKSLKISPGELSPDFGPTIYEYKTKVNNDITGIIVSAIANNSDAVVSVSGNEDLVEGQNRIVIKVRAANGTESKYVIYAVRSSYGMDVDNKEEISPSPSSSETEVPENNIDDIHEDNGLSDVIEEYQNEEGVFNGMTAKQENGRVFIFSGAEYEVCKEEVGLPEGFKKTSIMINGVAIAAYVPEDNLESEFLLLVLKNEEGIPGVYTYDRVEKTIQRYMLEQGSSLNITENNDRKILEITDEYEKSLDSLIVIIFILSGLSAILLVSTIRLFLKNRGIKNDSLD